VALYFDERTSESQQEVLLDVYTGNLGGPEPCKGARRPEDDTHERDLFDSSGCTGGRRQGIELSLEAHKRRPRARPGWTQSLQSTFVFDAWSVIASGGIADEARIMLPDKKLKHFRFDLNRKHSRLMNLPAMWIAMAIVAQDASPDDFAKFAR
jgi:hypothetical protein